MFIEESKLTEPVRTSLSLAGVVVNPYESLVPRIHAIQQSVKSSEVNKMWIDTKTASQAIFRLVPLLNLNDDMRKYRCSYYYLISHHIVFYV